MAPGRKPLRTREEFVEAAIDMADRQGTAAVRTRAVAAAVGASETGLYRYFDSRDHLLDAMRQELVMRVLSTLPSEVEGREAVLALSFGFRSQALEHACLAEIMVLPALEGEAVGDVSTFTIQNLRVMGIAEEHLTRAYQQVETFVIGSVLFDFAGQPHHLQQRLARVMNTADSTARAHLQTELDVQANNEAAFAASLHAILDSICSEGNFEK
jgi:AcrR family transcriptional regulator